MTTLERDGVRATYAVTERERVLSFEQVPGDGDGIGDGTEAGAASGRTASVAVNREGYGMLKVRESAEGPELERYYGFEMALDHAAELLGVPPSSLPVPDAASDMGM